MGQQWFSYVTLADHDALMAVADTLPNWEQHVVGLDRNGQPTPWNVDKYLADASSATLPASA